MKVQELLTSIHRKDFNIEKELQIKKYLPIEEKKLIAQGIIYECTEETNGVIKVDSVQQYLSYVKYMILRHTNLEYNVEDYDKLCSIKYGETSLLNAIFDSFPEDAKECSKILNFMMEDLMQENSINFVVAKFLNNLNLKLETVMDTINAKTQELNLDSIIPSDADLGQIKRFLDLNIK